MIHAIGYFQVIEEPSVEEMRQQLIFEAGVDRGLDVLPAEEIRRMWRQRESARRARKAVEQ